MLPKTLKNENESTVEKVRGEMPSDEKLEKTRQIFSVLSEPKRLQIVLALLKGELCANQLIAVCGTEQSTVSHQLRVLRDNKIVRSRRVGKNMMYSIADEHVRAIVETALSHANC